MTVIPLLGPLTPRYKGNVMLSRLPKANAQTFPSNAMPYLSPDIVKKLCEFDKSLPIGFVFMKGSIELNLN